jgi:hypothetical protein
MVERNVVARGELIKLLVVRDDRWNLDAELAGAVAEQQVVQAMTDLRHHDHHARLYRRVVQLPAHAEAFRKRAEGGAQRFQTRIAAHLLEMHAHEELAGMAVAELR